MWLHGTHTYIVRCMTDTLLVPQPASQHLLHGRQHPQNRQQRADWHVGGTASLSSRCMAGSIPERQGQLAHPRTGTCARCHSQTRTRPSLATVTTRKASALPLCRAASSVLYCQRMAVTGSLQNDVCAHFGMGASLPEACFGLHQ